MHVSDEHEFEEGRADGLSVCGVCHGAEGSLPCQCPRRVMTPEEQDSVHAGYLEHVGRQWWVLANHAKLLRRALPMLVRLGDFVGNGPVQGPGSLGERC